MNMRPGREKRDALDDLRHAAADVLNVALLLHRLGHDERADKLVEAARLVSDIIGDLKTQLEKGDVT